MIRDISGAQRIFAALRDLGVRVVLDDFGAGYSSLQILKSLPFDKIKIDRSLLQGVGRSEQADAIICAILRLAQTLDLATIAEGVETEEQVAMLRAGRLPRAAGLPGSACPRRSALTPRSSERRAKGRDPPSHCDGRHFPAQTNVVERRLPIAWPAIRWTAVRGTTELSGGTPQ